MKKVRNICKTVFTPLLAGRQVGVSCLFLIFFLSLILSCSNGKKTYVIGVSQCSEDSWRKKLNNELHDATYLHDNVVLRVVSADDDDNFTIMDTAEIAAKVASTTKIMTTLLGAVAGVSLLVGGIGIMNIMLVSVTERTREIGIRLAIGALGREVLMQFLIEALMLGCLGGLLGVLAALAASQVLCMMMDVPFIFNPGINILAFSVSAATGIVFGFFPARRAARLDPIEAVRHE